MAIEIDIKHNGVDLNTIKANWKCQKTEPTCGTLTIDDVTHEVTHKIYQEQISCIRRVINFIGAFFCAIPALLLFVGAKLICRKSPDFSNWTGRNLLICRKGRQANIATSNGTTAPLPPQKSEQKGSINGLPIITPHKLEQVLIKGEKLDEVLVLTVQLISDIIYYFREVYPLPDGFGKEISDEVCGIDDPNLLMKFLHQEGGKQVPYTVFLRGGDPLNQEVVIYNEESKQEFLGGDALLSIVGHAIIDKKIIPTRFKEGSIVHSFVKERMDLKTGDKKYACSAFITDIADTIALWRPSVFSSFKGDNEVICKVEDPLTNRAWKVCYGYEKITKTTKVGKGPFKRTIVTHSQSDTKRIFFVLDSKTEDTIVIKKELKKFKLEGSSTEIETGIYASEPETQFLVQCLIAKFATPELKSLVEEGSELGGLLDTNKRVAQTKDVKKLIKEKVNPLSPSGRLIGGITAPRPIYHAIDQTVTIVREPGGVCRKLSLGGPLEE